MAKLKLEFEIPIPNVVVDSYSKIKYQIRKWMFQLRPHKCSQCGMSVYVRRPQYEHTFPNGQRLTVDNISDHCLCRSCLADILETKPWKPRFDHLHKSRRNYRFWSSHHCDVTEEKVRSYKDVEIYPLVNMLFCTLAWNFSNVSKRAVIETVRTGKIRTHRYGILNKENMKQINDQGLFVDDQGKLI